MRRTTFIHSTALVFAMSIMGCAGGDPYATSGDIELGLVAASANGNAQLQNLPLGGGVNDIVSAIVTIDEIDVHVKGAGWQPILTTPKVVDLLKLDNTTFSSLGVTKLPTGHIDDARLILDAIGDYVVLKDGSKQPLEIPVDGKVDVDGKFDVLPCASGVLIVDFDPHIKTEDEPNRREYELLCEAHIKTVKTSGACGGLDGGTAPDLAGKPDMSGPPSCGGVVCAPNEVCVSNKCVANPCTGVICAPGETCNANTGLCQATDPCTGVVCGTGTTCQNGICVQSAAQPAPAPTNNPDGGCKH